MIDSSPYTCPQFRIGIHTAIRQIFGLAVRDDMIRKNPATEEMAEFRAKNHEKMEKGTLTKLE
jgi:hypothetical protein